MDIKPYPKNSKKHPDKQLRQIAASIKEFGWQQPIVVDNEGVIIVGHGRWLAYEKFKDEMELSEPEIKIADKLTKEQVKAYRLADNKLNESEWDLDLTIPELRELSDEMFDLTGFDRDLLIEPDEKDDVIPENVEPVCKLGDIWQLGRHRLLCGDSTDKASVERLMDGKKADMVWTDPPYGVSYGDKLEKANPMGYRVRTIKNDDLTPEQLEEFLRTVLQNASDVSVAGASIYVASPPGTLLPSLIASFKGSGFDYHWGLIWLKDQIVLSRADYHFKHENILYGWKKGTHYFTDDRKQASVFEYPRPKRSEEHPTMKPVDLIVHMVKNSSKADDVVLDLFLGSGSTLIAAEKTNRICYGCEISPAYCDVIIKRFENYAGQTARKLN